MPTIPEWYDVALRLGLAVAAGGILGLDREERGKPVGLRTTLLVCLAAAVSMVQVDLLLPLSGKTPESFAVLDLMRLPLGILTGMGFIGAGAIVRKGELVQGITTAATLWLTTVIGLCFGGGQIWLGLAALALGMFSLACLRGGERRLWRDRRGTLTLCLDTDGPTDEQIQAELTAAGYPVTTWWVAIKTRNGAQRRTVHCEVRWRGCPSAALSPSFLSRFAGRPGVRMVRWKG